eukprot:12248873-Karenia_brevis.AAC.1
MAPGANQAQGPRRGHLAAQPPVWGWTPQSYVGRCKGDTPVAEGSTAQAWDGDGGRVGYDYGYQAL